MGAQNKPVMSVKQRGLFLGLPLARGGGDSKASTLPQSGSTDTQNLRWGLIPAAHMLRVSQAGFQHRTGQLPCSPKHPLGSSKRCPQRPTLGP